ncbi:TetR/AcrR family transcriptional regulator [Clostridium omnivorum]|uniref:Transcriptional regulator n=1 Tax=Clostridium omnivorum TaxID=1604902 RepID=A0ABQ5N0P9_9CLOT|nr:TetR/AcrR family transcriptional regulator [Clostridium sp. E14]GLC28775.1 transcriptional regulator [Clostridium sp. E14]
MPKLIENVKEKLIIEGRKTLIEKNYKELNIRDIAKQCSIAIGTFYNYFPNKEEFVSEIFMDDWKNTLSLVDTLIPSDKSLRDKLNEIYISLQSFLDKYISIFYEIAKTKGYGDESSFGMLEFFQKMRMLFEHEKNKGDLSSELNLDELTHFVVSNLMYLIKNKYTSFEKLYSQMGLPNNLMG